MKCPHCGKEIDDQEDGAPKYTPDFLTFWAALPKEARVGKGAAFKAWVKIRPRNGLCEVIIASVEAHRKCERWEKGFIPNAATFLNQRRWEDELPPATDPWEFQ